jgi:hypothetical protein
MTPWSGVLREQQFGEDVNVRVRSSFSRIRYVVKKLVVKRGLRILCNVAARRSHRRIRLANETRAKQMCRR